MRHLQQAIQFWRMGDTDRALQECQRLLLKMPEDLELLQFSAELHEKLKDLRTAAALLERVVRLSPKDAAALRRLGSAYLEVGELGRAAEVLRAAIRLEPSNVRAHNNLGRTLQLAGDPVGAKASYLQALTLDPHYAIAHLNLGFLLTDAGATEEALSHIEACLGLQPNIAAAWLQRATLLLDLNRASVALDSADRALALDSQLFRAHYVRGRALDELQRFDEALACCDRALALRPDFAEAHYSRGKVLRGLGQCADSVAAFDAALKIRDDYHAARWARAVATIPALPENGGELDRSRETYLAALASLEEYIADKPPADPLAMVGAIQPFFLAYQPRNNRELMSRYGRLCSSLMADWQRHNTTPAPISRSRTKRRIGIVSAHIREHSVFRAITRGWLSSLNTDHVEIYVFHLGRASDAQTEFARSRAIHFEQGARSLAAWAATIIALEIDVLVYPELGMDQTTLQLASMRLAATQCVAWGHPETTGLPTMDYFLTAQGFESTRVAEHYTETPVCLPNLGCFYEPDTPPGQVGHWRAETPGPQLICAGVPFKYNAEHDAVFVDIARRLGQCTFHFFNYSDGTLSKRLQHRLSRAFEHSGLDAARFLQLHPWASPQEFRSILSGAHLMLDTIGFSGFNTVMYAIESDLPVVTQRGEFLRGRLGSGILERMGIDELIASQDADYVDIAVRLSHDPQPNEEIREKIRHRRAVLTRDVAAVAGFETFLLDLPR